MSEKVELGGCACGAIRFAFDRGAVAGQAHCHCRDCQRATGSAFATFCFVPGTAFELTSGEPKCHDVTGQSGGRLRRYFCQDCGSQLYSQVDVMPGVFFVKSGALDDASWFAPNAAFWCSSAQPWSPPMPDSVTRHEQNPG